MKLEDLKLNRTYRLARDVVNPELDKRTKWDTRTAPFTTGDQFRPMRYPNSFGVELSVVHIEGCRSAIGTIYQNHSAFADLVDALEEVPETLADVLAESRLDRHSAFNVLLQLVKAGVVTHDHVRTAANAYLDEEDT